MAGTDEDWRTTFRPDIPSPARVYDYLLGGKNNYPADREVGMELIERLPNALVAVQWNRAFLRRVVRYLVSETGIRQIIDVGAGLPTEGPTHMVAQQAAPGTRVLYIDHDPVVLAHARDMLHGVSDTAIIARDLMEPDAILGDPVLRDLINFDEPVAYLFLSMLHFVHDDADPAGLITRLLAPFPAGSYVAASHITADTTAEMAELHDMFENATEQVGTRTAAEILALFKGLEVVPPGLVWLPEWRPDPGTERPANMAEAYYYAVVARKPAQVER
jgi:SAM-dependent methyltransferase